MRTFASVILGIVIIACIGFVGICFGAIANKYDPMLKVEWAERAVNAATLDMPVRTTNRLGEVDYKFNPNKESHRWIELGLREDGVVVWRNNDFSTNQP